MPIPGELFISGRRLGEGLLRRASSDTLRVLANPLSVAVGLLLIPVGLLIGGELGALLPVAVAIAVFLVLLTLTPFKQRNEARDHIAYAHAVKHAASKWMEDVKQLLEIRTADEPSTPAEQEQHQKTTVRMYLEQHRDFGTFLIETMIAEYKVNAATRANVHSPKTVADIHDALESIEWGADRYG